MHQFQSYRDMFEYLKLIKATKRVGALNSRELFGKQKLKIYTYIHKQIKQFLVDANRCAKYLYEIQVKWCGRRRPQNT